MERILTRGKYGCDTGEKPIDFGMVIDLLSKPTNKLPIMKKIFLLAFLILFFASCKKDDPQLTTLKVTTTASASVALYPTEDDYYNQTNMVTSQVANSSGIANFTNLTKSEYYIDSRIGCKNNTLGVVHWTITLNKSNLATILLEETGQLTYKNNSSYPFFIYFNGTQVGTLPGGASKTFWAKTGSFTVRSLQVSGYLITATDNNSSGVMKCGDQLIFNFKD